MSHSHERDSNRDDFYQSILFGTDLSEWENLDSPDRDETLMSYESVAGLVELTATEIQDMPTMLHKAILKEGKEYLMNHRNDLGSRDS